MAGNQILDPACSLLFKEEEEHRWLKGANLKAPLCSTALAAMIVVWAHSQSTVLMAPAAVKSVVRRPAVVANSGFWRTGTTQRSPTAGLVAPQRAEAGPGRLVDSSPSSSTWSPMMVAAGMAVTVASFIAKFRACQTAKPQPSPLVTWAAGVSLTAALAGPIDVAMAGLPTYNVVRDAEVILWNALPVENKDIFKMEQQLESISRLPETKGPQVRSLVNDVAVMIADDKVKANLIASFTPDKKEQGIQAISSFQSSLQAVKKEVEMGDKQSVIAAQRKALKYAGEIQAAMVKGFPFEVPAKYASLPQLKGRATVECKIRFNKNPNIKDGVITIVLDGYNAPVTAGNFMDLVNRSFYNGMEIQRSDGFVVQTGDPEGPEEGFIDSRSGAIRRIPFEVKVLGTPDPYYESTLEDLGVYNAPVALPFNAFGTMAMARSDSGANTASSQFFWLLKDAELTPIGNNVLDGRYAAFGYIVDNEELLKEVKVGDVIEYMKVMSGADRLVPGDSSTPPLTFDLP